MNLIAFLNTPLIRLFHLFQQSFMHLKQTYFRNQMPTIFMKLKHAGPLSIALILGFATACQNPKSTSETAQEKELAAAKTVRAVTYFDNGAVVPFPNTRQVTFWVEDTTKILLTYAQFKANADSTAQKMTLSDPTRCEALYDNILELAELPDGIDIKPGKQQCVGSRGVDISVIYTNGDTSRFSIMGGARCDQTLCPSFWAIDSFANLLITEKK
jgi:hypothetical protein